MLRRTTLNRKRSDESQTKWKEGVESYTITRLVNRVGLPFFPRFLFSFLSRRDPQSIISSRVPNRPEIFYEVRLHRYQNFNSIQNGSSIFNSTKRLQRKICRRSRISFCLVQGVGAGIRAMARVISFSMRIDGALSSLKFLFFLLR